MLIEQLVNLKWGGIGPLVVHTSATGSFNDKEKILEKSSSGLLFTAELLHKAMKFAFPYLVQIT